MTEAPGAGGLFPEPGAAAEELARLRQDHEALLAQTARYAQDLRQMYQKERAEADVLRRQRERIQRVLDGDALSMVFQPIVGLRDRHVVGMEALARFAVEPRRTPDVWFSEAASVGLLIELELTAVRAALEKLTRIPPDAYLSINLSPDSVLSSGMSEMLSDIPGARVVIEITEHAPVEDYEALNAGLADLRAMGCRLAIDDTGAGFASLRHILTLAPDIIKLDITLTRGLDSDPARRALATALISFAYEIGATLVAEGVETEAEVKELGALGVGFGQGYFFARPAPL